MRSVRVHPAIPASGTVGSQGNKPSVRAPDRQHQRAGEFDRNLISSNPDQTAVSGNPMQARFAADSAAPRQFQGGRTPAAAQGCYGAEAGEPTSIIARWLGAYSHSGVPPALSTMAIIAETTFRPSGLGAPSGSESHVQFETATVLARIRGFKDSVSASGPCRWNLGPAQTTRRY